MRRSLRRTVPSAIKSVVKQRLSDLPGPIEAFRRLRDATDSLLPYQACVGIFWWSAAALASSAGPYGTLPSPTPVLLWLAMVAGFAFYGMALRVQVRTLGWRSLGGVFYPRSLLVFPALISYWVWLIFAPPARDSKLGLLVYAVEPAGGVAAILEV